MFKSVSATQSFPDLEKKLLEKWEKDGLVEQYLHKNDARDERFSFLDGPITANNPMGVHHAWGRTYKDIWQKYHNLRGKKQRFQSGFDCQGLWVEVEVEKELKLRSKKEIEQLIPGDRKASIARFVELCKQRVRTFSEMQTQQSQRLGYFMDWDNSYFTMGDENNYMIWRFIKLCHDEGWLYKGHESVPWCPRCETAISQHEMLTEDYKEVVHDSIYLELPIVGRDNEYLIIWTTTPWTIPANIAVSVDEKLSYSLVEGMTGGKYWVATDRVEALFKKGEYKQVMKTVLGRELVGLRYISPFDGLPAVEKARAEKPDLFHTVVATDPLILPISTTEGTGMVHTAVSAGTEDFALGKKLGLPLIPVIADDASYLEGLGFLTGKNAKKHPELILDHLKERDAKGENWVFLIERYKHRYPACWRCKAELVWKVADEWYIAMDRAGRDGNTFRGRMQAVVKTIQWIPGFGLDRELDWLANMHDWLISKKNRYWGLALPIYECASCKRFSVVGSKEELKQKAVSGWDAFEGKSPHKPYIDEVTIRCEHCQEGLMYRIDDVGNPWLDAGIVAYSTIAEGNAETPLYVQNKEEWKRWFPVDFITESFPGQFKNWFYALIAMSTALENAAPFKTVLGFATCMGEDGRAMHKSWGNYIEFNEGAEKIGVDVMRWMFARQNPAENMLFGYKKADEVRRQFYLMLWNTYKYFVDYARLDGMDKTLLDEAESEIKDGAHILDRWINARLRAASAQMESGYEAYAVRQVTTAAEALVSDLSLWYLRRSRDRVWVNSDDATDKLSFYVTLRRVLVSLAVMLSPIMPFVTEEMYTNLVGGKSVHLSEWLEIETLPSDAGLIEDMQRTRTLIEAAHRERKEKKCKVRQPLASCQITAPASLLPASDDLKTQLEELMRGELNVKELQILPDQKETEARVVYDTTLTPELVYEGKLRDLIREIQGIRKEQGVSPETKVALTIPKEFSRDTEYLKKRVHASTVAIGDTLLVS